MPGDQAIALRHDFVRIAILVLFGAGADVQLKRHGDIARLPQVVFENLRTDRNIGVRIERGLLAAQRLKLVRVQTRYDLHESFGAHDALGNRIESRLDGDNGEDQDRIQTDDLASFLGRLHHLLGSSSGREGPWQTHNLSGKCLPLKQ